VSEFRIDGNGWEINFDDGVLNVDIDDDSTGYESYNRRDIYFTKEETKELYLKLKEHYGTEHTN